MPLSDEPSCWPSSLLDTEELRDPLTLFLGLRPSACFTAIYPHLYSEVLQDGITCAHLSRLEPQQMWSFKYHQLHQRNDSLKSVYDENPTLLIISWEPFSCPCSNCQIMTLFKPSPWLPPFLKCTSSSLLSMLCASLPLPVRTYHVYLWSIFILCLKSLLHSIVTFVSEGALVSFPCVGMKKHDRPWSFPEGTVWASDLQPWFPY